jgi:uncharacterized protein YodC (DUF2158 family)
MSDFRLGDVVRLKAGGPKMTIERIAEGVECVWFDSYHQVSDTDPVRYGSLNRALFSMESLEIEKLPTINSNIAEINLAGIVGNIAISPDGSGLQVTEPEMPVLSARAFPPSNGTPLDGHNA